MKNQTICPIHFTPPKPAKVRIGQKMTRKKIPLTALDLINKGDEPSDAPIHSYAYDGKLHAIKHLIEFEHLEYQNIDGISVALYAAQNGELNVIKKFFTTELLLEDHIWTESLLETAASRGHLAQIADLITAEVLAKRNRYGETTAHRLARAGNIESVLHLFTPELLKQKTNKGETVVHFAACGGHLGELGGKITEDDLMVENNKGETPVALFLRHERQTASYAVMDDDLPFDDPKARKAKKPLTREAAQKKADKIYRNAVLRKIKKLSPELRAKIWGELLNGCRPDVEG